MEICSRSTIPAVGVGLSNQSVKQRVDVARSKDGTMEIKIDNPERSVRIIDVLMMHKYDEMYAPQILGWLEDLKSQITQGEQTERYKDTWRRLTDFPQYEINGVGEIRHRTDEDLVVEPTQGADGSAYVRLTKSRGIFTLNVQHLINKEFPEIKA
jgi:hypothetical protein